jgi:hypothetical protein
LKTWLRHPDEDALEEYGFHRLSESQVARLEEHLLACETCRAKLEEIDTFVLAMRQSAPELAPDLVPRAVPSGWPARVRVWGRRWLDLTPGRAALAGAMVVLCAVAIAGLPGTKAGPPVPVTLKALRGGDAAFAATAPAGRPLALAIEVPDIAVCAQCRVEMVNDLGRVAWSGNVIVADGRLEVTAPVELTSGNYWVRLYTGGADPAREFGLRLE